MIQQAGTLEDADRVLRENGKTFAWARRFLGSRHAERSTRLYAFCRYLDDVADESEDPVQAAQDLAAIRSDLERGTSSDPMLAAVLGILGGAGPGVEAALALIDGVLSDLGEVQLPDERALILQALQETDGNRTAASRVLGMPRSSLLYKMKRLKIVYPS